MCLSIEHERVSAFVVYFIYWHFQIFNDVPKKLLGICLHAQVHCVLQPHFFVVLDLDKLAIPGLENSLVALGCVEFF